MLMPFLDQLQRWAEHRPDAPAIEVDGDVLTFRQLRDAAQDQLAASAARDAETDVSDVSDVAARTSVTAVARSNSTHFVVAFAAGVAGSSRCAVLDPDWPAPVRHAVDQHLQSLDLAERDRDRDPERDDKSVLSPQTPDTLHDGPGESVFLYGFTSGTTSVPKAFLRTRRSWQLSFSASAEFFGLSADDRTLAPGPFSASLTLYALCESLSVGAAFVGLSRFDVGAALACLHERAITRLVAVPSALQLMAEREGVGAAAGLSSIVSAGSKLTGPALELLRAWAPNATIFEYYGAAELGFVSAVVHRPAQPAEMPDLRDSAQQATAVGSAFPGVELRIHDETGAERRPGESGRIVVRSPLVSEGYAWGDDGTAFGRSGDWCTVGDQGYLDHNQVLHLLGRRADMVTTGGHNVYPHEVEAVLQQVVGVRAALVTGLPDPRRGHRLVAAISTEGISVAGISAAALRAACQAALTAPKRPRSYYAVTEMPLTAAGKPSRALLARWILEGDPRVRPL